MSQQVAQKIAQAITPDGVISFARFMELALYCPDCGYYEKEGDRIGRAGDFYTSVSVGSVFGELLAVQFARWLLGPSSDPPPDSTKDMRLPISRHSADPQDSLVFVAEAGAHNGVLAGDILRAVRGFSPRLFHRIRYVIVEPSPARSAWQKRTLFEFQDKVRWVADLSELSHCPPAVQGARFRRGFAGVLFSNELLDAMPVHRLCWDRPRQAWFEWGVTTSGAGFAWKPMECTVAPPTLPADLLRVLPDGFIAETCPQAEAWYRQAAALLRTGWLVTIDYGLTGPELLMPERLSGTLRAYAHHRPDADPLVDPGDQDITAHVNFDLLEEAGRSAGLSTRAFLTQEQFLTAIVAQAAQATLGFPSWTPQRLLQLKTLTHPAQLGRPFRVLVQSR